MSLKLPPDRKYVRFYDDVVIKSGAPEELEVEAEKTRRAYEFSRKSGLFRVPNVNDFNKGNGQLVLERIQGITVTGLMNRLAFGRGRNAMVERIGRCLAVIHDKLRLEDELLIELNENVSWSNESVFLHGDFSLHNVCCTPNGEIVILDWRTTKLHGGIATHGTYFFDLAWFMMNLFFIRTQGFRYAPSLPMTGLALRFARSYLAESGRSSADFGAYLNKCFATTIPALRDVSIGRNRFYLECLLPFHRRFISLCSAI